MEETELTVFWPWSLPFVVVMAVWTRGNGEAEEEGFENKYQFHGSLVSEVISI
jgi:hypothetical protein